MRQVKLGITDRTVTVFIPDPASTDGSGKTGLVAADLTVSYTRVETDNDVTVTDVTSSLNNLSTLTDAHNDWGLLEVSSTLAPGLYRLDCADAVFASGAWEAVVYVEITSSAAAASPIGFELVAYDPLDTVRLGLTALPNAAAEASGGLYTRGSGAGQINQAANGQVDVNAMKLNSVSAASITTVNANIGMTQPINFTGTGASALVKGDMVDVAGSAVSTSTAQLGVNVVNNAGSAITSASGVQEVKVQSIAANAITATSINADAITDAKVAADVTIASVTGAVGSVTGNVGGNVTGSVGSIASGGIAAASFAAGAIDAAAIAADAIGASELAADAVTEIAAGISIPSAATVAAAVWDLDATAHQTQGTFGQAIGDPVADTNTIFKAVVTDATLATVGLDTASIQSDTDDIQTRLPAALSSGNMKCDVLAISADSTAADNAESFFDGTGYAGTNNVIPTVTTVTGAVGSVTGSVGSVVGAVGSVTGNVGGNVTGSIGSLATQAKADVNAEVLDVLATDTYAEPGQGSPAATTTLAAKINYIYKAWRNKKTQTSTTHSLFADDAATVDQKSTVSDDGTTATRGEVASGP